MSDHPSDMQDGSNSGGRPPVGGYGGFPPPPAPQGPMPPVYAQPPAPQRSKGSNWLLRVGFTVLGMALLISVIYNVILITIVRSIGSGPTEVTYQEGETAERVVILPVRGPINAEQEAIIKMSLDKLAKDPPAAVVLRVDSPDGGVDESDRIAQYLREFREKTNVPVVASFGGLAASGGYYISAESDYIIAERHCITGSIGVIAMWLNPKGLLEDRLKIETNVLTATTSKKKDLGNNPFRLNEQDREKILSLLDAFHAQFKDVVLNGRGTKIKPADVDEATSGEAFLAPKAKDLNLIDDIGYLKQAIAKAAELGKLPQGKTPTVMMMAPPQRLLDLNLDLNLVSARPNGVQGLDADTVRGWLTELTSMKFEYRYHPGH